MYKKTKMFRHSDNKGEVLHVLKQIPSDLQEVYCTKVNKGSVKGWKKHNRMNLCLFVIEGRVKFYIRKNFDEKVKELIVESNDYSKLEIHSGIWVAFEGMDSVNVIINAADYSHDPQEFEMRDFDD